MPAEAGALVAEQFVDPAQQEQAATLGMWVFLATEVLFFGALFASYTVNRFLHQQGFALASNQVDIVLGGISTAVLLTSSLTMSLAIRASRTDAARGASSWMGITIALGLTFLVLHGVEYYSGYRQGLIPILAFSYTGTDATGVEMFFFLYYVMTALHGLHLFLGVCAVSVVLLLNLRGRFGSHYSTPVALTGLYWHFVDIVWLFLFPLLYLVGRA